MTPILQALLKQGAVLNHALVEIDGLYTKPEHILRDIYPGALVRISKYVYRDGKTLIEGGPKWANLFEDGVV